MLGEKGRTKACLVWLCAGMSIVASALGAQALPDYWPLQVGNRWVYRHTQVTQTGESSEEMIAIEVVAQQQAGGHDYFALSNGQLLRTNGEGNLVERNRFTDRPEPEFVIFDFTHLEDSEYRFYFPYAVFPPTLGYGQPAIYPTVRYTSGYNGEAIHLAVAAGTFAVVQFGNSYGLAEMYNVFLAMNVGVVLSYMGSDIPEEIDRYELVEYRLDGKTYPTAVAKCSWAEAKKGHLTHPGKRQD
jgi:hypothetical protein